MKVCSFCSPQLTQNCVSESVRSEQPWIIPAVLLLASLCSCGEHPQCTLSWCFQLHNQLGHTDVFRGFEEGVIAFDPTYKFDTGTDVYDTRWVGGMGVFCFTCCPSSKAGSTLSLPTTVSQPCRAISRGPDETGIGKIWLGSWGWQFFFKENVITGCFTCRFCVCVCFTGAGIAISVQGRGA